MAHASIAQIGRIGLLGPETLAGEAEVDTRRLPAVRGIAAPGTGEWRTDLSVGVLLAGLAFALYLLPAVLGRPLTETAEARIGVVAREMLDSGNYMVPSLGGQPRLNKPPLAYWVTAGIARVLSGSQPPSLPALTRAVELTSALAVALTVLAIVLYASAVFGRSAAVLAGMIFGLSTMVLSFAWVGCCDTILMLATSVVFFTGAWLVCSPKPGVFCALTLGVSLGLAILTKGHIPLLLLLAPVLAEIILRRAYNGQRLALFALALFVALLLSVPWFIHVYEQGGEIMRQEVVAALTSSVHHQSDRVTYYFYKLAGGLLPWLPILLVSWIVYGLDLRKRLDPYNEQHVIAAQHLRFLALAALLGFIGFYAAPKQQGHYLLPLLPPIAAASGFILSRFKTAGGLAEERLAWAQLLIGLLSAGVIASIPFLPYERFAESVEDVAEIRTAIANLGGVPVFVAGALLVLVLNAFLARQWVEARMLRASLVIAAAMYVGALSYAVYTQSKQPEKERLPYVAEQLRADLEALDASDAAALRVYAAGPALEVATFYLNRPVLTIADDLQKELADRAADAAPQRVLLTTRKALQNLIVKPEGISLDAYVPAGADHVFLLPLPKEVTAVQGKKRRVE